MAKEKLEKTNAIRILDREKVSYQHRSWPAATKENTGVELAQALGQPPDQVFKTLVTEYDVIGVDICGMYPEENSLPEYLRAERVNIRSDEELYRFLQKNLFCWSSHI